MAPQKGGQANKQQQPHPAKQPSATMAVTAAAAPAPAAGNAAAPVKKPTTAAVSANRPAVVPAIPLPLLQRQSSKHQQRQNQHHRNTSSNLASPTQMPSSNGFPATSLEAALIDIQSGAGEPALALQKAAHAHAHAQKNLRTSGNGVPVDTAGMVATAASNTANGTGSTNEKVNGNGNGNGNMANKTNGIRKHPHDRRQPAANGTNGTNGTNGVHGQGLGHSSSNGVASITFGDVAPDLSSTTGRTTPDSSADTSMAPSAMGDGDSHNIGLSRNHHPGNALSSLVFEPPVSVWPLQSLLKHPVVTPSDSLPLFCSLPGPDCSENGLPSSSAPTSQPQSATHLPADFMSSPHAAANGHHPFFGHLQEHFPHSNTSNGHGPGPGPGFPNGVTAPPHLHGLQHPVNGNGNGVVFGGMGFDSHSSSPAPLSAGFMPPPGPFSRPPINGIGGDNGPGFHLGRDHPAHMRGVGHGHGHTDSNGTNFPLPLTPYRAEMNAMSSAMDGRGPITAPAPGPHGPFDGHPSAVGPFGPNAPHGFLDPTGLPEPNGAHRRLPFTSFAAGVDLDPADDDEWLHSTARWMREQFDSPEYSDCTLEFVFLHSQTSQTFYAHKLVLARSPTLRDSVLYIVDQRDPRTISMRMNEKHTHPDAWRLAVHHLYQAPLPNFALLNHLPGNRADHFYWSLSYAAAGHALNLRDILVRGLRLAEALIGWDTVEAGLSFALEEIELPAPLGSDTVAVDSPHSELHYGPESRQLVSAILFFLVNRFPADFVLDKSVTDSVRFARLPIHLPPPKTAPAIARGSSGIQPSQDHGTGMTTRLASLQFGDIPPAFPEDDSATRKPAECSPELSRVLLNLPFPMLQIVLTSESNGISGWNTAQDRYHAVKEVVAEREARRLRAVEHLRTSTRLDKLDVNLDDIKERLSRESASDPPSPWDVLNWEEEVLLPRGAGVPVLGRKWVPQFTVPKQDVSPQATV